LHYLLNAVTVGSELSIDRENPASYRPTAFDINDYTTHNTALYSRQFNGILLPMIDKDATHITAMIHYDDIDLNLYYLG